MVSSAADIIYNLEMGVKDKKKELEFFFVSKSLGRRSKLSLSVGC